MSKYFIIKAQQNENNGNESLGGVLKWVRQSKVLFHYGIIGWLMRLNGEAMTMCYATRQRVESERKEKNLPLLSIKANWGVLSRKEKAQDW